MLQFWISRFSQVLDTLESLDREVDISKSGWMPSDTILLDDWETLAILLPGDYTADSLDCIYQERQRLHESRASISENLSKMNPVGRGFLPELDDDEVQQLMESIKRAGCPPFARLKSTLEISKADRKALSQIMSHVVAWVNPCPSEVKRTCNNKPPLCKDL